MADGLGRGLSSRRRINPKSIIAAALEYAEGEGEEPDEIESGRLIERYGVEAVYGRPLFYGEMTRISAAQNVLRAYLSRASYRDKEGQSNWGEWATLNPGLERLLLTAYEMRDNGNGEF